MHMHVVCLSASACVCVVFLSAVHVCVVCLSACVHVRVWCA